METLFFSEGFEIHAPADALIRSELVEYFEQGGDFVLYDNGRGGLVKGSCREDNVYDVDVDAPHIPQRVRGSAPVELDDVILAIQSVARNRWDWMDSFDWESVTDEEVGGDALLPEGFVAKGKVPIARARLLFVELEKAGVRFSIEVVPKNRLGIVANEHVLPRVHLEDSAKYDQIFARCFRSGA